MRQRAWSGTPRRGGSVCEGKLFHTVRPVVFAPNREDSLELIGAGALRPPSLIAQLFDNSLRRSSTRKAGAGEPPGTPGLRGPCNVSETCFACRPRRNPLAARRSRTWVPRRGWGSPAVGHVRTNRGAGAGEAPPPAARCPRVFVFVFVWINIWIPNTFLEQIGSSGHRPRGPVSLAVSLAVISSLESRRSRRARRRHHQGEGLGSGGANHSGKWEIPLPSGSVAERGLSLSLSLSLRGGLPPRQSEAAAAAQPRGQGAGARAWACDPAL